jgi:diguanylate cyclase
MRQEPFRGPDRGLPPSTREVEPDGHAGFGSSPPPLPPPHEAPERYRALDSSDPVRQLRDALTQIETLLHQNARLSERVLALRRSLTAAAHLALHDELTGLANRRLLLDRFQNAIAQRPDPQCNVALAFLDLDGFKRVNDRLGHATGDRLLRLVAARLLEGIRDGDTACRYGGDEFVVLLTGVAGREGAAAALAHITACLVEPYLVDDHAIDIQASIGLAVHPFDGDDFDQLVRVSDRAMGRMKGRAAHGRIDDIEGTLLPGLPASPA